MTPDCDVLLCYVTRGLVKSIKNTLAAVNGVLLVSICDTKDAIEQCTVVLQL